MDPVISQIISILFQAVEADIKYGPAIIADLKLAYQLATSGTNLTEDQKAFADAAVAQAHKELQDQLAKDAQDDATVS